MKSAKKEKKREVNDKIEKKRIEEEKQKTVKKEK